MPFLSSHKDLFHIPTVGDNLIFLHSFLDDRTLNADEALALLKIIHTELTNQQGRDHSGYREYALGMSSLHHYMPDVHQQVVEAWKTRVGFETGEKIETPQPVA